MIDANDSIQGFSLAGLNIRGVIVHLEKTWQRIYQQHPYPAAIATRLAESVVCTALLSATIKTDGALLMQLKMSGALSLLVSQCTHDGQLCGVAQYDEKQCAKLPSVNLTGGQLVITATGKALRQPHQSIVPINQAGITCALQDYFSQSEQLPTAFYTHVSDQGIHGLLLQQLPSDTEKPMQDFWQWIDQRDTPINQIDLTELNLPAIITQISPTSGAECYDKKPLRFGCRCSQNRAENAVITLGKKEAHALLQTHKTIDINCEFCGQNYVLDKADVSRLFEQKQ